MWLGGNSQYECAGVGSVGWLSFDVKKKKYCFSCGTKLIEDDWFFPGCSDPAMDSGQVELEEELSAAGKMRPPRRKGSRGVAKLQVSFYILCLA